MKVFTCLALLCLSTTLVLSACSDEASLVEQACERDDECNFLPAGTSVSECIDEIENVLDDLTDAQRNDVDRVLEACLEFETCAVYDACLN